MTIYYKATRPDGTDFYTGTINYAGALAAGETLAHPDAYWGDVSGYLSVSVAPGETLIGGRWPCRLFIVEPVGEVRETPDYPHKRAVHALRVIKEIDAWQALGPNGASVARFIESIPQSLEKSAWVAAWAAAADAAMSAARGAAFDAARDAAGAAARAAAWVAARNAGGPLTMAAAWAGEAITVKDLITPTQFDALMHPWHTLTGQDH